MPGPRVPHAMKRFLPLLALPAAAPARAAGALCLPGMPWCDGGDLGLVWVPIVVALQLVHLYYLQGGPGVFLARFVGDHGSLASQNWGLIQVGLPIATVLSFPPLIGLTVLGKVLGSVGVAHIAIVQGLYWLWLRRWLKGIDGAATGSQAAVPAVPMVGAVEVAATPELSPAPGPARCAD